MTEIHVREEAMRRYLENALSLWEWTDMCAAARSVLLTEAGEAAHAAWRDGAFVHPAAGGRFDTLLVLYAEDAYLSSDAHRRLAGQEGYCAMPLPVSLAALFAFLTGQTARPPARDTSGDAVVREDKDSYAAWEKNRTVTRGVLSIPLTRREWAVFSFLYRRRGHVVSREELLAAVWQKDMSANSCEAYISRLRRKLSPAFGEGFLVSVRTEGYLLRLPYAT